MNSDTYAAANSRGSFLQIALGHLYYLDRKLGNFHQRRAQGLPIFPGLVIDYDVYECEPWKLPSHYFIYGKERQMFFFTPRYSVSTGRHKNMNRFHVRRTAGEGSWESSGSAKSICNGEAVIGSKTALVFKRKDKVTGAVTKTDWIMHEYLLASPANQFQELALCKIYYNGKGDINNWEGMTNIKKRKLTSELPSTCAATFSACSDVVGPVFSPPEISSCMTQWEVSGDQFLIPEQLVTREEEMKEQSAAATAVSDQDLLTELALPSYQCTTINLPPEEEEIVTPVDCFEGLDDILNPQDYNDLWGSSYWHYGAKIENQP